MTLNALILNIEYLEDEKRKKYKDFRNSIYSNRHFFFELLFLDLFLDLSLAA